MNGEIVTKELWEQAQKRAKEIYEDDNVEGAWESADKYEREDYIWFAYDQITKRKIYSHTCFIGRAAPLGLAQFILNITFSQEIPSFLKTAPIRL